MARLLFVSALTVGACANLAPQVAAPNEAACTADTVLVPGIPGSPGHLIPSSRNPNGDSELAALMRRMVVDWEEAKVALATDAGVAPRFPVHRRIRCAWPTSASDRDAPFDAFAVAYVAQVRAFDERPSRAAYEGVLNACQACHEVTCGGPLEVIDALR